MTLLASMDSKPVNQVDTLQASDNSDIKFTNNQLSQHLSNLDSFSQPMMLAIDQTIQQHTQDIISIYNNYYRESSEPKLEALPDVISDVKAKTLALDKSRNESILNDSMIQNEAETLFESLRQSIIILWEIISEFMVQHRLIEEHTLKEYFSQIIESSILKLEYVPCEVIVN
jgi:hypothetical protein